MGKLSKCFNISIAGLIIEIDTVSLSPSLFCYDFICEGTPDFSISVTDKDVEYEKEIDKKNNYKVNIGTYESYAIYRKIVDKVIPRDIFLIHGATIAVDNHAILFSAPSKTGKTTHIKKWLQNINGAYVVNGDKPLIKMTDSQAIACGTPWAGSEQYYTNTQVPLTAIVFMERNEKNEIKEILFQEAYPYLLQQTYLPGDAKKARMVLSMLNQLNEHVRFYKFRFNNFAEDCFEVSYNALIRG